MTRMIFVNLPVADLAASRAFYTGLGFGINEQFSCTESACVVVSDTICVMLLPRARFADFVTGEVADAHRATQVLLCLSARSRTEVDDLVSAALTHGGGPWLPLQERGPMYGHSFADPDGHAWEVIHMDAAAC